MKIAIIGTGYVGLVTGACFADFGHTVACVDSDAARIDRLRRGEIPFYEPGLGEIVERNRSAGRLRFTTDTADGVSASLVVILAVGTPEGPNGEANLSQLQAAAVEVARSCRSYRVVVTKSTVPIGTGTLLRDIIGRQLPPGVEVDIVSNPEFLREGSAISDFMRPDRVVIGTSSERATAIIREMYRPLYLIETPMIVTSVESAEMIKYAANAFLAVKISFINQIANLCDRMGADVHVVAKGMGLDKRIGSKFLHPGPGYGGSCFPKDTRALASLGRQAGAPQTIVESAIEANARQRDLAVDKILVALGHELAGKRIAVLGLAFKPGTSDVRESPAIHLCRRFAALGADVRAFDPVANAEAAQTLEGAAPAVLLANTAEEALDGADALVLMTEWNEFRSLDLDRMRPLMRRAVVLDARNMLDPARVRALGFEYLCTGRASVGAVPAAVGAVARSAAEPATGWV
jgi:UDPglucose 6-dehydrogenase